MFFLVPHFRRLTHPNVTGQPQQNQNILEVAEKLSRSVSLLISVGSSTTEELTELIAQVAREDNTRDYAVRNNRTVFFSRYFQTEPAVDHTQHHQYTTPPDVHVADQTTALDPKVVQVV